MSPGGGHEKLAFWVSEVCGGVVDLLQVVIKAALAQLSSSAPPRLSLGAAGPVSGSIC